MITSQENEAFVPLTKKDAAELLKVTVRTIEHWIAADLLPAPAKIGNRAYWHPDVFYQALNQRLKATPVENEVVTMPPALVPVAMPINKKRDTDKGSVADRLRASTNKKLAELAAHG